MTSQTSQQFESFVPVYDTVPEKWEDARQFLVEHLKKISNAVNVRTIGYLLDEELLSGQSFVPGATVPGNNPGIFRSVLRKTIIFPTGLAVGANTQAHGITVDANFTLIHMFGAATNTGALTAEPLPNGTDTLSMDATNIIVTVAAAWTRASVVVEYIQEL